MRNNSPLYHPLTYDEINVLRASLSAKKFQHDLFRAFLFICETGVSWEDVTLLKWTQIDRESHILFYDYERVNGYQTQRLSQFALNVLPEKNSNKVFSDLHCDFFPNPYGEWQSSDMLAWGQECNIKRRFCLETAGATFVTQYVHLAIFGVTESQQSRNKLDHHAEWGIQPHSNPRGPPVTPAQP